MKALAAIVLIAACSSHDDGPTSSPAPVRIDAAVRRPSLRGRRPPGTWRIPFLWINKNGVSLAWRARDEPDNFVVTQSLQSWTCPPLHDALVDEAKRTWGRTPVRPPDSEELLVIVDPAVPDATVFAITKCVNDPSDPRPPYRDVVITPNPSESL